MAVTYSTSWDFDKLNPAGDPEFLGRMLEQNGQAVKNFIDHWAEDRSYLSSVETLRQALDEYEQLQRQFGFNSWQTFYYSLKWQQNQTDDTTKAAMRQADEKAIELYNQIQFFALSLAKMPIAQQRIVLQASALEPYHYYLEQLFAEQAHVLSEPEEAILNLVAQPAASAWVDMTESFLAKEERPVTKEGNEVKVGLTELMSLISNPDKIVRDQAAVQVQAIMADQVAVATEEMNALLSFKKIQDDLRGFSRPDAARHLGDGVSSAMVDSLLEAVSQRNDLPARFYSLKASLLQQKQLAYHERNVEVGKIEGNYRYQASIELVLQVLGNLSSEYARIAQDFFDQGQVDGLPTKGKSGGAFCAHNLLTQPTYIMLNHTDRLQDVLTMAHELGHGINNELSRAKQHALTFGTSLATAEVASTFMEDFVLEELSTGVDKTTELAILMMKLNDDMSSIFRQVACYRFEQALHAAHRQAGYLSTEQINGLFKEHMEAYMGPAVEQSAGSERWWVYWSHIRNPFYVYSYASGLLISKSLQAMVRQDAQAIDKVSYFLAAGTSASPEAIFKQVGLDITQPPFWQTGLSEVESLLDKAEAVATELKLI